MAILPTGFGKSVIFELSTLVKMQEDELTSLVIVSPLTSIMEDQIKDFQDLSISAVKLSCDEEALEEVAGGKYRVIFGSAEAVLDECFRKVLKEYRTSCVEMCMQPCKLRSHMISLGDNKRNQTCFLFLEEKTQREKVVDSLIFRKD